MTTSRVVLFEVVNLMVSSNTSFIHSTYVSGTLISISPRAFPASSIPWLTSILTCLSAYFLSFCGNSGSLSTSPLSLSSLSISRSTIDTLFNDGNLSDRLFTASLTSLSSLLTICFLTISRSSFFRLLMTGSRISLLMFLHTAFTNRLMMASMFFTSSFILSFSDFAASSIMERRLE